MASAVVVGLGIGHFKNARHAAHHGGQRTGLQIFLMFNARFAEMNLRVDDARQNGETGGVDMLATLIGTDITQCRKAPVRNAYIDRFTGLMRGKRAVGW